MVRPFSLYISYCNIVTRKGWSVSFNKSAFAAMRVLCAQQLDFSEEKPLEPDLLLPPAEAKHFNFISTALPVNSFSDGQDSKSSIQLGAILHYL